MTSIRPIIAQGRSVHLKFALSVLVLVGVLAIAVARINVGEAHAEYDYSEPAADSVVTVSPLQIVVYFTEEVDPDGVVLVVSDAKGVRVDLGDAVVDLCDASRKRVVVSIRPKLQNGTYLVEWQTMSNEDHEEDKGSFTFIVSDPNATPIASPVGTPESSPEAPASPVWNR